MEPYKNDGRVLTGIFLVIIGLILLAFKMGAPVPAWLITWPVGLIVLGLAITIRHKFRVGPGLILILVGSFNLVDQLIPDYHLRRYTLPVIVIMIGLFFLLRPKKFSRHRNDLHDNNNDWKPSGETIGYSPTYEAADYIDATCVLGGTKKIIVSKNFKGGDITCFMGGAEIDLSQADIQGNAMLDLTMVFGGCKLIVPANWQIKSEIAVVFGGVDDKRVINPANVTPGKVLILEGTAVFGGIDIRSY